jgi:transcriptional regulator CtsR
MKKLTSDELSDTVIESLSLAVALLERFETMNKNGLFIHKSKLALKNVIPHIEQYVEKLITPKEDDEVEHMKKGATVVNELCTRIENALQGRNVLDISQRKDILQEIINDTTLTKPKKKILYETIRDSGVLEY